MYELEILKDHILHLLQKDRTPRRQTLLEQELGVHNELRVDFQNALDALCDEGRVIIDDRYLVKLPSPTSEITGIFHAHARDYGFVSPQKSLVEGDVFIPAKATLGAMTGDRVMVQVKRRPVRQDQDRLTGKIIKILERAHTTVVGILRQEQDQWLVQPDGSDFLSPIEVDNKDTRQMRQGDKVAVEIRVYPSHTTPARGVITEILGHTGRYETEISAIIQRHHLQEEFAPSALVEAVNARSAFDPRHRQKREDLTDTLIITIDPPDAKDFDDALSLTRNEKGFWVLGLHIADVSHFVVPGSALDQCARERGNSVYLPGKTLPMLPEILSNGICSLQPDKPRYTKSVFLTYNKDGQVLATRFANTIIKSQARLTYPQADQVLRGKTGDVSESIVSLLQDMEILARLIEKRRCRSGMLQLSMPESEVILNESGQVTGVQSKDTSYPHTIIEMFMVEANVAVASLLDRYCIPFMRRIHPEPDLKALRRLSHTLRLLGVTFSRRPHRADFQKLLAQVRDSNLALPVNLLVLRSLAKATYAGANIGHYALAASKYCHFTSPIRRYADLMVHRVLQDYLCGRLDRARQSLSISEINDIGRHITDTEQAADEAEQEVKTIFILHLLQRDIGREFKGVIVSLTRFGAYVHLPDYHVEGMLRREALGPDFWQFDEKNQCLIGRHTGTILRLAQTIRVRIVDVRPAGGQLDLAPAVDLIPPKPRLIHQQKKGQRKPTPQRRRIHKKKMSEK